MELEFRDCGTIPGQGLLLTAERQIDRGDVREEIVVGKPVEESQEAMEARGYC